MGASGLFTLLPSSPAPNLVSKQVLGLAISDQKFVYLTLLLDLGAPSCFQGNLAGGGGWIWQRDWGPKAGIYFCSSYSLFQQSPPPHPPPQHSGRRRRREVRRAQESGKGNEARPEALLGKPRPLGQDSPDPLPGRSRGTTGGSQAGRPCRVWAPRA